MSTTRPATAGRDGLPTATKEGIDNPAQSPDVIYG